MFACGPFAAFGAGAGDAGEVVAAVDALAVPFAINEAAPAADILEHEKQRDGADDESDRNRSQGEQSMHPKRAKIGEHAIGDANAQGDDRQ